jgi:large subunit ribosomal protein L10
MLTRQEKQAQVEGLRAKVAKANSIVAVDYRGMTVDDANTLRNKLRQAGGKQIEYRVTKNTLLKIATRGTPHEPIGKHLEGPTAVAIAYEEPSAMAKVLIAYAKENEKFKIKGGVVDGETVDPAAIGVIAQLPTKLELRGMLAGTLQSPLRNLAGTLQSLLGHLRNALEQRQQKLEAN